MAAVDGEALRVDDVAEIIGVGRNRIYKMARGGEIGSYRIGRKLLFTRADVEAYLRSCHSGPEACPPAHQEAPGTAPPHPFGTRDEQLIISGKDTILDVLANYVSQSGVACARSYRGSYDSLTALYKDEVQVAACHLWDAESGTYNLPYVKRLLPGVATVVIHLTKRTQGLYVAQGNPKGIRGWQDLKRDDITLANREKGAGSRVLLDECLRLQGIAGSSVRGYETEVNSHLSVATMVASGRADVAVGGEKIARQVEGLDFIPLRKEAYELVVKRDIFDSRPVEAMMEVLEGGVLQREFACLDGYDTAGMGRIVRIEG